MIDPATPTFDWGQPVAPELDLLNDGSYPDLPEGAVLVPAGTRGDIVRVGVHAEVNLPIYLVEFPNGRVVGCFEHELNAIDTSALLTTEATPCESAS
jgi:nitrogen fixation protein NifZ